LLSVIINPIDIQMGNENEKGVQNGELAVSINHPRFQNARLSGEGRERSLTVSHGVDEREHEKWAAALTKAALDPTFLLLPKRRDFSRKGFCGDSGTLRVPLHPCSLPSTTTPTCSPRRSTTATARRASSNSQSSGSYCWDWSLRTTR
jgi:hypothetical protein